MAAVHLDHWWVSPSEILALNVVRDALEAEGMTLVDDAAGADVAAVLMSAQTIWSGVCGHGVRPVDLAPYVTPYDLESRIFSPFRAVVSPSHLSLHGIPMGAFRNNCMWVNKAIATHLGGQPRDIPEWLEWLGRASAFVPFPLGLGREAWQLSLLFEVIVLGLHGPDFHRRAFGMGATAALGSQRIHEAVDVLAQMRRYISRDCATHAWHELAADEEAGRCAAIVMGDWVHHEFVHSSFVGRAGYETTVKWTVPGTDGSYLYNVDYIVPVERQMFTNDPETLGRLTRVLLRPQLQCRFGRIKGALPAVRDAIEPNIDPEGWKLFHLASLCPEVLVPSMSQLQGSPRSLRDGIANAVRQFLFGDASVCQTTREIAASAGQPMLAMAEAG